MKISEVKEGLRVIVWGFDSSGTCNYESHAGVISVNTKTKLVQVEHDEDGTLSEVHVSQLKKEVKGV